MSFNSAKTRPLSLILTKPSAVLKLSALNLARPKSACAFAPVHPVDSTNVSADCISNLL